MANRTAFQELGSLLRGGPSTEQPDALPKEAAAEDSRVTLRAPALSQLASMAREISKVPAQLQASSQPPFSQESLIVAPLQFQPPSQPEMPPVLPDSQVAAPAEPGGANPGEDVQPRPPAVPPAAAALLPFTAADFMAHPPMMLATAEFMAHPGAFMQMAEEMQPHVGREKGSKPTRRGPMDEMRQLVRILVKLLPQSIGFIGSGEEAGGGNRISEEQIKVYLEKTLGEAPRPTWGVPGGWHQYVSQLFSWALGRSVSEEDAKRCAKREPGRSWEALDAEMAALGVHPNSWPLPLTLEGVQAAEKNPVPQPVPQVVVKRSTDEQGQPVSKRQKGGGGGGLPDLEKLGELELWTHLLAVLAECSAKQGKALDQAGVMAAKLDAKQRMDVLVGTGGGPPGMNMFQYVPVAMGLDGGQSVMALLQGGMMLPQVAGAQFGLQAQQGVAPGNVTAELEQPNSMAIQAAAANVAAAIAAQAIGAEERSRKRGREGSVDLGSQAAGVADDAIRAPDPGVVGTGEKAKHAPLSSQEARGTLFGALGGSMTNTGTEEQHGKQAPPLVYAQPGGVPGAAMMMPNLGMIVQNAFGSVLQGDVASPAALEQKLGEDEPKKQE